MQLKLVVILFFCGILCFSQNKPLLYGLSDVPQSLLVNPGGKTPYSKVYGIPLFSQIHLNVGSSGVTVYDIFQESDYTINIHISQALSQMDNRDYFTATQQLELLYYGWKNKNDYFFSAGMYQEFDFITYFPKDWAVLAWEGNQNHLNRIFDLNEFSLSAEMLTVFHVGVNKKINEKLTLGGRFKVYSSMFHIKSTQNRGTFVTTLGDGSQNIYNHLLQNADVQLHTSGMASLIDNENTSATEVAQAMLGRAFFGGNLGVGIDLGATYQINDSWELSGSVLDLGLVFHSKDIKNFRAHGSYNLTGINLLFPALQEGETTYEYYQNLEDEIKNEIPIDTLYNSFRTFRPLKFYVGIIYKNGRFLSGDDCNCLDMDSGISEKQAFGVQFFGINRPKRLHYAATFFYYRRLTPFLAVKASYTVDDFSYSNIGLAAVTDIGKFNFYVAVDNLLSYSHLTKANLVSLQLGFNLKID